MRQALTILGLLMLVLGCKEDSRKDFGIEPGEVEATVMYYITADYFNKGCSVAGLIMKVDNDSYLINNTIASEYSESSSLPISVWVRYESAPPDSCAHWTNRINILSIRKKQ